MLFIHSPQVEVPAFQVDLYQDFVLSAVEELIPHVTLLT